MTLLPINLLVGYRLDRRFDRRYSTQIERTLSGTNTVSLTELTAAPHMSHILTMILVPHRRPYHNVLFCWANITGPNGASPHSDLKSKRRHMPSGFLQLNTRWLRLISDYFHTWISLVGPNMDCWLMIYHEYLSLHYERRRPYRLLPSGYVNRHSVIETRRSRH